MFLHWFIYHLKVKYSKAKRYQMIRAIIKAKLLDDPTKPYKKEWWYP